MEEHERRRLDDSREGVLAQEAGLRLEAAEPGHRAAARPVARRVPELGRDNQRGPAARAEQAGRELDERAVARGPAGEALVAAGEAPAPRPREPGRLAAGERLPWGVRQDRVEAIAAERLAQVGQQAVGDADVGGELSGLAAGRLGQASAGELDRGRVHVGPEEAFGGKAPRGRLRPALTLRREGLEGHGEEPAAADRGVQDAEAQEVVGACAVGEGLENCLDGSSDDRPGGEDGSAAAPAELKPGLERLDVLGGGRHGAGACGGEVLGGSAQTLGLRTLQPSFL